MGVGFGGEETEGAAGAEYVEGAARENDFTDWNVVRREFLEVVQDLEIGSAGKVVKVAVGVTDPGFHNPVVIYNASCAGFVLRADQFRVKRFTVHRV